MPVQINLQFKNRKIKKLKKWPPNNWSRQLKILINLISLSFFYVYGQLLNIQTSMIFLFFFAKKMGGKTQFLENINVWF